MNIPITYKTMLTHFFKNKWIYFIVLYVSTTLALTNKYIIVFAVNNRFLMSIKKYKNYMYLDIIIYTYIDIYIYRLYVYLLYLLLNTYYLLYLHQRTRIYLRRYIRFTLDLFFFMKITLITRIYSYIINLNNT